MKTFIRNNRLNNLSLLLFSVYLFFDCFSFIHSEDIKAECNLVQSRNSGVTGRIEFTQNSKGGKVKVKGEIDNLLAIHGFHIHENSIFGNNCTSGGAHYNPFGTDHGARDEDIDQRHIGDLGNIEKDGTKTKISFDDDLLTLIGEYSIIGKSCMVHESKDDLGLGEGASKVNGNAGARISCGTVTSGIRNIVELSNGVILKLNFLFLFFVLFFVVL